MSNGGLALVTKCKLNFSFHGLSVERTSVFFSWKFLPKGSKKIRACESYKRKKKF